MPAPYKGVILVQAEAGVATYKEALIEKALIEKALVAQR
jgi:hypothetical protein